MAKLTQVWRRFWRKAETSDGSDSRYGGSTTACWRWRGGPTMTVNGKKFAPIRVAMRLDGTSKDDWTREIIDDPTCAFEDCINPFHKTFGRELTPEELEQEHNGPGHRTKLDDEAVHDIRYAYDVLGESQATLARLYGVTQQNVCAIVNRKTWTHLTDE